MLRLRRPQALALADGDSLAPIVFSIAAVDDVLVEGDEAFTVAFSAAGSTTGANISAGANAEAVTIIDNDTAEFVIAQNVNTIAETGETAVQFTISLEDADQANAQLGAGESVSVTVGLTSSSTAIDADDHVAFLEALGTATAATAGVSFDSDTGVLTFTATEDGDTLTPIEFSVEAIDDNLVEGEESFTVALSSADSSTGAAVTANTTALTTTISDNDAAQFEIAQNVTTIAETEETTVEFTISLVDPDNPDATAVLGASESAFVTVELTGGSATEGVDQGVFAAALSEAVENYSGDGSVTFDASSGLLTFSAGSADQESLTPIVFELSPFRSVAVSSSAISPGPGGFDFAIPINTADTAAAADTVDPLEGDQLTPITFSVGALEDNLVEGDENFTVALSNAGSDTGADVSADETVLTTTISDNDAAQFVISQDVTTIAETDQTGVEFTISLVDTDNTGNAAVFGANETAFVTVAITGSAVDGVDQNSFVSALSDAVDNYSGDGSLEFDNELGVLTFTAGEVDGSTLAPIVFSVEAIDDNLVEGHESFDVQLSDAGSSTGAEVSADTFALTTTIADNDTANFTLTQSSTSVDEGESAIFTLALAGTGGATVPSGTTDAALQAGNTASIDLDLTLLGPTSLNDFDELEDQSLNETNPLYLAILAAVNEHNSTSSALGGSQNSGELNTFGVVATSSGATVTYYGDSVTTTPTLEFDLSTFQDDGEQQGSGAQTHLASFVEPDEQFQVSISNPQLENAEAQTSNLSNNLGAPVDGDAITSDDTTLTTTIVDDDSLEVSIEAIRDATEGNDGDQNGEAEINGLFEITLSNPSQNEIQVVVTDGVGNPLIENGTAETGGVGGGQGDFENFSSATVTFFAGDQSENIIVDVLDDQAVEGTETVVATINLDTIDPDTLSVGDVTLGNSSAQINVFDDDSAVLTVQDVTVNEDDQTASVVVTLTGDVQNGFTVPFAFTDGSATGDDDFNNATGILTFSGNDGETATIVVPISTDDVVEADETFTVSLGAITPNLNTSVNPGVATVDPSQVDVSDTATVTIANDDTDVTISITDSVVEESNAAGTSSFTFTVTRTGLTTGISTVDYEVSNTKGNSADADDFGGTLPSGTVTFERGPAKRPGGHRCVDHSD